MQDCFMTFSGSPTIQRLTGTVTERFAQLRRAHWEMNTNIEAVFKEILRLAKEHSMSQSEMPEKILIISDMEFDEASGRRNTNYEQIKLLYQASGYELPHIVFWNVNGRLENVPAQKNDYV